MEAKSMSRNGSIKEAILGIYLKERPHIISNVLGFEVHYSALEQRHGQHNIDLKCVDKKRRIPILFELQLGKATVAYQKRVKKMISTTQEGVIVWVALAFDATIIEDLKQWLEENQSPYTDFYAISLHEQALPVLQKLNSLYKLDIYNQLSLLDDVVPLLSIELESKRIPFNHCGHTNIEPIQLDYEQVQDVNRGLLVSLRKEIPYYLNFHYDKKFNQFDHIVNIGAGKYGVVYRCSAGDSRGKAFVELYFDKCRMKEYEAFKLLKEQLRKKIHPELNFDKRRIGVYFEPADTYVATFEKIAEIFDKMIKTFSPYFYGGQPIEITTSAVQKIEPIKSHREFVDMRFEIEERDFETEDSYRIRLEELSEIFSMRL